MNITAAQINRGDRVLVPGGHVTVKTFTINWAEDFKGEGGTETVTITGTLNGKGVRKTLPATTILTVIR